MSDTPPTTFENDRRFMAGHFSLHADRKAKPFVSLSSGLSHAGGNIRHILSIEEARELAKALVQAADFAAVPTLADTIRARQGGG